MSDSWKYVGDGEREIPVLRLVVKPGDTFEVEEAEVSKGLEGQEAFEKVKAAKPAPAKSDTIT